MGRKAGGKGRIRNREREREYGTQALLDKLPCRAEPTVQCEADQRAMNAETFRVPVPVLCSVFVLFRGFSPRSTTATGCYSTSTQMS